MVLLLGAALTAVGPAAGAAPPRPVDPGDTSQIDSRPCTVAMCEIYYSRAYVHDVLMPIVAPGATAYGGSLAAACSATGPAAPVCAIAGAVQVGQGWGEITTADKQNQCVILKTELISPLQASWMARADGPVCDALDR